MKKNLAFLAIFVLMFNLFYTKPIKAADPVSIPFSWVPDLVEIAEILLSGGEINLNTIVTQSNTLGGLVEGLRNYKAEHEVIDAPVLSSQENAIAFGLSALALSGVDTITTDSGFVVPITFNDIANYMNYSKDWVLRFADNNILVPTPDELFLNQINTINGSGFSWANYSFIYGNNVSQPASVISSPIMATWVKSSNYSDFRKTYPSPFVTIYLNGNVNDGYSALYEGYSASGYTTAIANNNRVMYSPQNNSLIGENVFSAYYGMNYYSSSFFQSSSSTFFNTLSDALNYIATYFRNVNIFVNGECWALVGGYSANPAIGAPVSIPIGDTGEDTYNVYGISKNGDLGLDLAKFGQWLLDKMVSGSVALTIDDLIADEVDVVSTEEGDRAITEDDAEDVAKVIAQSVPYNGSTPTPTPDIGDPPVLKIIPPILDLPDEIWPDGGRDTTVLAQIIHATDVAIPNDIMTVFWSIIGILVIGGLISILHK